MKNLHFLVFKDHHLIFTDLKINLWRDRTVGSVLDYFKSCLIQHVQLVSFMAHYALN